MTRDSTVLKTYSLRERPELEAEFERLAEEGWPRFMRQRDELGSGRYWPSLFTDFAEWQTALCGRFDRTYVVPGALQPVSIDRDRDEGRYEDPNVWMVHPVRTRR